MPNGSGEMSSVWHAMFSLASALFDLAVNKLYNVLEVMFYVLFLYSDTPFVSLLTDFSNTRVTVSTM